MYVRSMYFVDNRKHETVSGRGLNPTYNYQKYSIFDPPNNMSTHPLSDFVVVSPPLLLCTSTLIVDKQRCEACVQRKKSVYQGVSKAEQYYIYNIYISCILPLS